MEKITDCKFDLEYVDGYEPIINDPGIVDLVISACRKNMGEDSVKIEIMMREVMISAIIECNRNFRRCLFLSTFRTLSRERNVL